MWYKRDPDKALVGMFRLSLEERGAYNTILDLIYAKNQPIDDDDYWLAGNMRCSLRVWRRIKAALIAQEKIYVEDGLIHNAKADVELSLRHNLIETRKVAGRISAERRGQTTLPLPNNVNGLASTHVATHAQHDPQLYQSKEREKKEEGSRLGRGGAKNGGNGQASIPVIGQKNRSTIENPGERLARFQANLARHLGAEGWSLVVAAADPQNTEHERAIVVCKAAAKALGKGWPLNWPKHSAPKHPP